MTERQKEVFEAIVEYQEKYQNMPTVRTLGDILGVTSPATTHTHIKNLVLKGYLERFGNGSIKYTAEGKKCALDMFKRRIESDLSE